MFFNKNLKFYRKDKTLLIKKEYTKEELEDLYENVYIYNLSKVIGMPFCRFKWFYPSELTYTEGGRLSKDFTENSHNSFLKDMTDKTLLGKELMDIGMYITLVTTTDPHGKTLVLSGGHRTVSAKMLCELGQWNGKKLLAIDVNSDVDIRKKLGEFQHDIVMLDKEVKMRIPTTFLFSSEYIDYSREDTEEQLKSIDGRFITPEIIELPVDNNRLFFRIIQMTAYWLSEAFCIHRNETGEIIQPHPVINDMEAFEKWQSTLETRNEI